MLDWLRKNPREVQQIEVAGRLLPVEVRRNDRARRLTMRLASDGGAVLVTIPRWTPTREALAFARSRADWLELQLIKIPAPREIGDGAMIPFRGLAVAIRHDAKAARRVSHHAEAIHVGGPLHNMPSRLQRWLKAEAQALLAADLAHYCARAEREPPALLLSGAQRRWGSCSAKGAIRINWRLVMAPDNVRRSVVAHEVAHLAHFDHSPQFHAYLALIFDGDLPAADRWLKREGRSLYAHFG